MFSRTHVCIRQVVVNIVILVVVYQPLQDSSKYYNPKYSSILIEVVSTAFSFEYACDITVLGTQGIVVVL